MKHPDEQTLALFAGDDLSVWQGWRVRAHVRGCAVCKREVEALRASRAAVAQAASEMPKGVNWDRLSQEIAANIRVGLAAGECVDGFERAKSSGLRGKPAFLKPVMWVAAVTAVFVCGFVLNLPGPQAGRLASALRTIVLGGPAVSDGVVWDASQQGIQVREGSSTMSLLPGRTDRVTVSMSVQSSAGARYVDSDTGQVTINKVYYEQ